MKQPDYSQITESPGLYATREQLERIYHRYHFSKQFCKDKDVVEVACGSGIGLGYLATFSQSVIGGDIDDKNLSVAQQLYQNNPKVRVVKMDAHAISLPDKSVDVILLYEAIYYLSEPEKFIYESSRVLRPGGMLLICSVNKDWKDFHPSPFTHRYFSIPELVSAMRQRFKEVKVYGAFKTEQGLKASIFSFIKHLALKMDLIPGSLKLRAYLKRIFMGKTFPLPNELYEGITEYQPPVELPNDEKNAAYKIIYYTAIG